MQSFDIDIKHKNKIIYIFIKWNIDVPDVDFHIVAKHQNNNLIIPFNQKRTKIDIIKIPNPLNTKIQIIDISQIIN